MLVDLHVRDLGVIDEILLSLPRGMIALTGETGAGKTLVVEALGLLRGGRADAILVRPGADTALVEGRFVDMAAPGERDDQELFVTREIPATGRSRAWIDGRMAPVGVVGDLGGDLVDVHGQHGHQRLLRRSAQRDALDRFAAIDLSAREAVRTRLREIGEELARLGGDTHSQARHAEMLRFQIAEIEGAKIRADDEVDHLEAEERTLADASGLRDAALSAAASLAAVRDDLAQVSSVLEGRPPFGSFSERTKSTLAEVDDLAGELRHAAERIEDDPERLQIVRERRLALRELCRKYGKTLAEVAGYAETARADLAVVDNAEKRIAEREAEAGEARAALGVIEAELRRARSQAAPQLAAAVGHRMAELGMPRASVEVRVGDDGAGDDVEVLFSANPGEPLLPLAKVASGGELARAMLALSLVLGGAPPTVVFDEVDAGIGGAAALAVGRALSELAGPRLPQVRDASATAGRGGRRGARAEPRAPGAPEGAGAAGPTRTKQVIVVTHLAQVAAFADCHVVVTKEDRNGRSVAAAREVAGDERVAELARMLAGSPDSPAALAHARELLDTATGVGARASRVASRATCGGR